MSKEQNQQSPNGIPEDRRGKVTKFSEMKTYLPGDLPQRDLNVLGDYFRAALRISEGRKDKAREIFDGLKKRKNYLEIEDERSHLLAKIDIATRGSTRWNKDASKERIENSPSSDKRRSGFYT